ncbi:MAG: nicotinate-nucleotide adenylyltransferase [Cyanosarcina radialis HA8281-LM2]|jgi:nicotinate-nucleotide adenylyltransferase|nr:nicotinate-nucleotide adenylyltransferase [Cyanosarcina radialis HA8281-LM2]
MNDERLKLNTQHSTLHTPSGARIALFGTSADPPTAGHQAIMNWLSENYDRVVVWASDNPLKSHQTPLFHREAMLRLLIEEIEPPRHNLRVYSELSSPRTIDTLQKAKTIWASAQFTLVIGSDLVNQLPRWYRARDLLQQVQLLVVPRPGSPIDPTGIQQLEQMGAKVAIASLSAPSVSSTAYREQRDPHALTPTVEAYINRERLYLCQNAATEISQVR